MQFSQIFYAHLEHDEQGNDVYVDIYPDRCATEMFGKEEVITIVVTECKPEETSKYWAWLKFRDKRPYRYVWHEKYKTMDCIKNWKQKEAEGAGKLVNVKIRKWKGWNLG